MKIQSHGYFYSLGLTQFCRIREYSLKCELLKLKQSHLTLKRMGFRELFYDNDYMLLALFTIMKSTAKEDSSRELAYKRRSNVRASHSDTIMQTMVIQPDLIGFFFRSQRFQSEKIQRNLRSSKITIEGPVKMVSTVWIEIEKKI